MFLGRILKLIADFKKYIYTPFKVWFLSFISGAAMWEYRGAIDMQEYLPAETVEIRINKLQSFLLWLSDWQVFSFINNTWKFMTNFFGFSKYVIVFIILAIISIIIYRIINYFYTKIRPKRHETEKQGLDFLTNLVRADSLKPTKKVQVEQPFSYTSIFKEPEEQIVEKYIYAFLNDDPNAPHIFTIIKNNKISKNVMRHVAWEMLNQNQIEIHNYQLLKFLK